MFLFAALLALYRAKTIIDIVNILHIVTSILMQTLTVLYVCYSSVVIFENI